MTVSSVILPLSSTSQCSFFLFMSIRKPVKTPPPPDGIFETRHYARRRLYHQRRAETSLCFKCFTLRIVHSPPVLFPVLLLFSTTPKLSIATVSFVPLYFVTLFCICHEYGYIHSCSKTDVYKQDTACRLEYYSQ
jgi:hypothetical protein